MRDLGQVAVVIAAALAIVAMSVFAMHDTSVLVPPPDAVAETFVRELGMSRYVLARHYLARDVKEHTSVEEMRSSFERVREATGRPDQVVTAPSSTDDDHARVLARLEGRRSTAAMYVDLIREHGMWKVAAWPLDFVQRP